MLAIKQRFGALERSINLACSCADHEIATQLRRHCVVLICGFVERSVEIVILERLSKRAQPVVLSYIKSQFKRGKNYDCDAISSLLARFETDWKNRFAEDIKLNEQVVEGLSSLYGIRNVIAHGNVANISSSTLKDRCADAELIVAALIAATA